MSDVNLIFDLAPFHYPVISTSLTFNAVILAVMIFYLTHVKWTKLVCKNLGIFILNYFQGSLASNLAQIVWYTAAICNKKLPLDNGTFEKAIVLVMVYGVFVMKASPVGVILQRLLATLRLKDFYPHSVAKRCFFNTLLTQVIAILGCYGYTIFSNNERLRFVFTAVTDILALSITLTAWVWNKRLQRNRRKKEMSQNQMHQINENIPVLKAVFCLVLICQLLDILRSLIYAALFFILKPYPDIQSLVTTFVYPAGNLIIFVLPLVINTRLAANAVRNTPLTRLFRRGKPPAQPTVVVIDTTNDHFEMLRKSWN